MDQQVKMPAMKPGDQSYILGTQMVNAESQFPQVVL